MLQSIISFFEYIGVNPILGFTTSILGIVLFGLSNKKLEYKIEDEKEKKTIKVYKYK